MRAPDPARLLAAMDSAVTSCCETRGCRFGLLATALAPLVPQLLGSWVNIWYNAKVITPLLATELLRHRFNWMVVFYNLVVFPIGTTLWVKVVYSLRPGYNALCAGETLPADNLRNLRRRLIHLPLWGAALSAVAWLLFIPTFFATMLTARD